MRSLTAAFDIYINQGATFYLGCQWVIRNSITKKEKPVDLTGYIVRCQLRKAANSTAIVKEMTGTIENAQEGRFSISMSAEETSTLSATGKHWQDYDYLVYDVELVANNGLGEVERILNGIARVSPNVTRTENIPETPGGSTGGDNDNPGGSTGGNTPGGGDDDNPGGQTPGGDDNPGGNPGGSTDPDPSAFFTETITTSEASAWLDTNKYTIPSNMTKLKVTAISSGGGMSIGYITNDEPWEETDDIVTLDLTSGSATTVLAVTAGSTIRPIFNYWSGVGTLTIRLEGSNSINAQSAAGTIAPYLGK